MRKKISLFKSIKTKLLGTTIIISLIMTISISTIWYSKTLENAKESAVNYVYSILKHSNDSLDDIMRDVNSIVTLLSIDGDIQKALSIEEFSSNIELLKYERDVTDILYRMSSFRSNLRGIMVANFEGRFYEFGTTMLYEDIIKQTWFDDIFLTSDKTIIPPHYYKQNNIETKSDINKVISIARPLYDKEKVNLLGFIIADIRNGVLQNTFDMNLENNPSIFILDNKTNEIIFESNHNTIQLQDMNVSSYDFELQNGIINTTIDNKPCVLVYYKSQYADWTTVGVIAEDELLKKYYSLRNIVLLVSGVFIFIAIIVIYVMSNVLTKNLRLLNQGMKKITKDNLETSVVINSKDEIGDLSKQFNYLVLRIKQLIMEIKEKEKAKKYAELKALKDQINPHFLFNTLNTIKFLAMIQRADNIVTVSESLSTLMHTNMDKRDFIAIEEEIDYLISYLNIQKYKYNNKFTYVFDTNIEVSDYYIPKLILQPLAENSLIHGFSEIHRKGKLYIKISKDEDKLIIQVIDNGKGMDTNCTKYLMNKDEGIGLSNIDARIKLYFGKEYGLTLISKEEYYTKAIVIVPLLREEDIKKYD